MLKAVWPGLLLDDSIQLSPRTHHSQASWRARPLVKLRATRCSATSLGAGHRT